MKRFIFSFIFIFVSVQSTADSFKVIGYSMSPDSEIVQEYSARYVTDIICFAVEAKADGGVDYSNLASFEGEGFKKLVKDSTVRYHLAVGGWGKSEHFAEACETEEKRGKFIQALLDICLEYSFTGIDFDWEFPKNDAEKELNNLLLIEAKEKFSEHGLLVTSAIAPWQKFSKEALLSLDRVHLMTYDFPGRHSTLKQAQEAVKLFMGYGVKPEDIYLGLPFYGRKIDKHEDAKVYRVLMEEYELTPDMDEVDGYYFNGPETIAEKVKYAREAKLGGVMIWELGQDVRGEGSLLKAIDSALKK